MQQLKYQKMKLVPNKTDQIILKMLIKNQETVMNKTQKVKKKYEFDGILIWSIKSEESRSVPFCLMYICIKV